MANNLSIEAPNFEKITKEAGPNTASAISTIWAAYNDTRKTERLHNAIVMSELFLKPMFIAAAASVDNLDIRGYSMLVFTGGTAQNFTGMIAPETGRAKAVFVLVTGAGTITQKHNVTSELTNRLVCSTGADIARATGTGIIYLYSPSNSRWDEVART